MPNAKLRATIVPAKVKVALEHLFEQRSCGGSHSRGDETLQIARAGEIGACARVLALLSLISCSAAGLPATNASSSTFRSFSAHGEGQRDQDGRSPSRDSR
jgi:hypothetical protein